MKRLQLLAAALLTLAVSQLGPPHKTGQAGIETVVQARVPQLEPSPMAWEPFTAGATSRLTVVFGPPPPPPALPLPPWEECEPVVPSAEEITQAQREIAELMRGAPRVAPPVQP